MLLIKKSIAIINQIAFLVLETQEGKLIVEIEALMGIVILQLLLLLISATQLTEICITMNSEESVSALTNPTAQEILISSTMARKCKHLIQFNC